MKLSEKKFICDVASMLFAAGVLGSAAFIFLSLEAYMHMMPLVFGFGALMLLMLSLRFRLTGRKGLMWTGSVLTGLMMVLCAASVIFPGGM